MMIIGEGHGGTESNNKLFNYLIKSVSALVVQSAVSAVCQCRVQCPGAASGQGVTTAPLLGSPPRRH